MNSGRSLRGLGLAWREAHDAAIDACAPDFLEVMLEHIDPDGAKPLPMALTRARARRTPVALHSVSFNLGGAEWPDRAWLAQANDLIARTGAVLISDHLAFVRHGERDLGHLLPLPWTAASVDVICENIRVASAELAAPLAVENIAALFHWRDAEMPEWAFIRRILDRTDALLLLDLANLHASAVNCGQDAEIALQHIPFEQVAYVHVAGGEIGGEGLYHDTHSGAPHPQVLALAARVAELAPEVPMLLECDEPFPEPSALSAAFDDLAGLLDRAA